MGTYSVYMHENKINNKVYIGITSRPVEKRWENQGKGYKNQKLFYRAIVKYGWDSFNHIVLCSGLSEAARINGFSQGTIGMACRGERKTAYGYQWKYAEVVE